MLIALLAWLPLSIVFAVMVGKWIRFGMDEAKLRQRPAQKPSTARVHPAPTLR